MERGNKIRNINFNNRLLRLHSSLSEYYKKKIYGETVTDTIYTTHINTPRLASSHIISRVCSAFFFSYCYVLLLLLLYHFISFHDTFSLYMEYMEMCSVLFVWLGFVRVYMKNFIYLPFRSTFLMKYCQTDRCQLTTHIHSYQSCFLF